MADEINALKRQLKEARSERSLTNLRVSIICYMFIKFNCILIPYMML